MLGLAGIAMMREPFWNVISLDRSNPSATPPRSSVLSTMTALYADCHSFALFNHSTDCRSPALMQTHFVPGSRTQSFTASPLVTVDLPHCRVVTPILYCAASSMNLRWSG